MSYRRRIVEETFATRLGATIVGCTAALTLSFFGVVALATGEAAGALDRVPFYVLGMAMTFVGGVVSLDGRRRDGRTVIVAASLLAVGAFVFLALGGEGLIYALRNPDRALASRRILYLVAAGLMATGIGYWGVRYWRDVFGPVKL